ncbi:nucleotidyltransferase domain-containing protein [bacterium]|nr:MAG: nucleotidyltransferase domain-containing protein [bacterium]
MKAHLPAYPLYGPELPASIADLVRLGVFLSDPDRVLLFGSQARGSAAPWSDWDLAFVGIRDRGGFTRLRIDVEEEPITLRDVDLVPFEEAGAGLQEEILRDGVVLYEK